MNTQQLARADYLDILFDGRNKTYGAFELRRNYAQRTRRALGVVLGVSCLLAAYPLFASRNAAVIHGGDIVMHPSTIPLSPLPIKKVEVRPSQQAPQKVAAAKPSIMYTPPKIVPDALVVKPPVTVDSLKGKLIASTANEGLADGPGLAPGLNTGTDGPGTVDAPAGRGRDHNEIVGTVDQKPEFNGNLLRWLGDHLDYPAREESEGLQGSVMMQFVVNEDGSISDVKTLSSAGPGFDAEAARVIKMMPRWKPAKLNGEAVRTWFRLPVVFALAGD